MIIQFAQYEEKQDKWTFTKEVHASIKAATIRAKVKGWTIVHVRGGTKK